MRIADGLPAPFGIGRSALPRSPRTPLVLLKTPVYEALATTGHTSLSLDQNEMASIAPIHAGDSSMAKGSAVAPEHHEMLTLRSSRPDDKKHDLPTTSTTSDTAPPPEPEQTKAQKRTELIRFLALLYAFFFIGWQDGSVGPLLPAIRANYKVCRGSSNARGRKLKPANRLGSPKSH